MAAKVSEWNVLNVYSKNGILYFDDDCMVRINQSIYQDPYDDYFLDENLQTKLKIINTDSIPMQLDSENPVERPSATTLSPKENEDQQMGSTSSDSRNATEDRIWPTHIVWASEETLCLISLMQDHIENYDEKPKSIADLENKIRLGRGKQKQLWVEFTEKLCTTFEKLFDSKRVTRKWQTLIDGFKKALLNNSSTGKAPTKFAFFSEMNSLIGDRHDINFVVTATAESITIHRPSELGQLDETKNPDETPETEPGISNSTSQIPSTSQVEPPVKKRKRNSEGDEILKYMKESDREMTERTDKLIKNMETFQNTFQDMMGRLLDKL